MFSSCFKEKCASQCLSFPSFFTASHAVSQTDRAAVRKVALHGIRATDMALHFDKCKELEKLDGMCCGVYSLFSSGLFVLAFFVA